MDRIKRPVASGESGQYACQIFENLTQAARMTRQMTMVNNLEALIVDDERLARKAALDACRFFKYSNHW